MLTSFDQFELDEALITALKQEGIVKPTAIQEQTIPFILANRDVVGQSETGTGKTLAYLLPIFQKIDTLKRETQAMILTPTHELAIQIQREIETLAKNSGLTVTSTAIIGNVNIARQIEKLKEKQHIIVGSSGRILELIQKKKITSQSIKTMVLDEADRLLDENNSLTVKAVIKTTLSRTQLLLFSATLPPSTLQRASEILKNPEVIRVTDKVMIAPTITHWYFLAEQRDKIEVLRKLIHIVMPTRALIFINKSEEIEKMVERLKFHGLEAEGIYGGANKTDRRKAMEDFRSGKISLLVASDLAARGLDIKGITHIINLDLPEDPQLYLHRVGRTARAGESGIAISIVSAKEIFYLKRLESAFEIIVCLKEMHLGKIVDPIKKEAYIRKRKN
ncbi:DEAD/DEAH box helicase family protein [Candidatus Desulfosporosinus infrequens]|uniref:DEAD/DEAH box helicase family protein n=1 Tax=Candidatus Desulfosporosinus infrequens TaxID=2043169 RepID=A0A2U3KIP2_9FIRM|nr:DEAD/DEAH box helicase family protein [Candidatus Desulfosporosinus infrequens]